MTLSGFMNILDGAPGGGGGVPEGQKDLKSIVSNVGRIATGFKQALSKKAGLVGINFGIASLLKQSQLFTGFIGSIFQIVGGFIDVLLAPFMPFAFKILGYVAKIIPFVQEKLTVFTDWIGGIWEASDGIGDFLGNLAAESFVVLSNTISDLWSKMLNYDWGALVTKIYNGFEDSVSILINALGEAFPWLKPELDALSDAGTSVKEEFSKFKEETAEDRKSIGSALGILAGEFKDSVTEDLKAAGQALGWVTSIGSSMVFQFLTDIVGMTADVIRWTGDFWDYIKALGRDVLSAWDFLKTFFTGGFNDAIVQGVKDGVGAIKSLVLNIWDWLGGIVDKIKNAATSVLNAVLDPIKALIKNIGSIVETIGNPGKAIGGLFGRAREGLGGLLGGGGGGSLDITINGSSLSPQEMAEGRASVRGNIAGQGEFSANQLMFDGG